MSEEKKTHYRNVFKSDHLGVADLEELIEKGTKLIFTIKEVKQYVLTGERNSGIVVAGKRISANIAFFKEDIKPMVINAINGKTIRSFVPNNSPMVEDWKNISIELYIDPTIKMKGETVGGFRIKPKQPQLKKPNLVPSMPEWNKAIEWLKKDGTIEGIKKRYDLTVENEQKLKDATI